MSKSCDICGAKAGLFNAFRCQDGVVCKRCYRIVSNNYATTISGMTLLELKKNYIKNAQPVDMGEGGFQTTRKIGAFLLLDEKKRKFCILNNQKMTGENTRPEIYPYAVFESAQIISEPNFSAEQLSALAEDKSNSSVIRKLAVQLHLKGIGTREIVIVPTPVRASSFAFRQAYKVAKEVFDCLTHL